MAGRLVEQLVDAGLLTAAQVSASHADDPLVRSNHVVQNLVASGLDERALAGFFISLGFGPMLQEQDLLRADEALVRRLPGTDAHELCAMPLRSSPAGAIVAMADPTDQEAVSKLSLVLGGSILPTVAKLSDLLASIDRAYPPDRPTLVSDPLALARGRTGVGTEETLSEFDPALSNLASTASTAWDRAWHRSTTEREVSLTPMASEVPAPNVMRSPLPVVSDEPPSPYPKTLRPTSVSNSAIDAHLTELSRASSRDDVARIACHACLAAARGAAFLALRKGVFRGWDGAGDNVTSAGIRSLWVPASNPSILNEVLHTGRVFRGAYGQTAADHLFRAALGSQGRDVVIVPVLVGSRMVGVLCANDPVSDTAAIERVAEAMGEALERLIVSQKTES